MEAGNSSETQILLSHITLHHLSKDSKILNIVKVKESDITGCFGRHLPDVTAL
jgi:hypothetical protein